MPDGGSRQGEGVASGTLRTFCRGNRVKILSWESSSLTGHFRVLRTLTCKTRLSAKMSFMCMSTKSHFYINGFILSLALKQRLEADVHQA